MELAADGDVYAVSATGDRFGSILKSTDHCGNAFAVRTTEHADRATRCAKINHSRDSLSLHWIHAEADKIRQALSVFYGPFAMEADTPSKLNVSIVADPSTNSLVVSAEEGEWEGIEALIAELDNEAYDSSLQVRVLPLTHAEAKSVARSINEAFSREVTRRGATARQSKIRKR